MSRDQDKVPYKYPEVPFQRYGHTAVAHGTNVYIFGGRNDFSVSLMLISYFNTQHLHLNTSLYKGLRDFVLL